MQYVSTRGGAAPTSLSDTIVSGAAPDGGLFVPVELPRSLPVLERGPRSLADCACLVLAPFFAGDALEPHLGAICREAFAFEAPLVPLGTSTDFALELFHGPTASFKDFGARFLAACLRRTDGGHLLPLTGIPYETLKTIISYQASLDGVSTGATGPAVGSTTPPTLGK